MKKIWLVFKHEYLKHVGRKRFILSVLSLPLMILVIIGVGFVSAFATIDRRPIGYVDLSGGFTDAQPPPREKGIFSESIDILRYDSAEQAARSVESGEIQGAFIIQDVYLETGTVEVIANEPLASNAFTAFEVFAMANLLAEKPAAVRERVLEGPALVFRSLADDRQFHQNNFLGIIVPIAAGVLLVVAINMSGGYLLQAVTDEKENRTMEIIVTSVSPNQLMVGKIFGNLSAGLTQIVIWAVAGTAGVALAMRAYPEVGAYGLDLSFLGLMLMSFLPAFIMVASLMAMIGATAAEARDAQQISVIFTLPIAAPLWFISVILEQPNSPLAIGLSLFPFTAPLTLPMRGVLTTLPWWQVAASIGILTLCAIGALWLASRAFRLGMLRYGKKLTLRELLRREVKPVLPQNGINA